MINIVFDLDDTLYSLFPVFKHSYNHLFPDRPLDIEALYLAYREEANKLFSDSQTGTISMDTFHRLRAQRAFKRFGICLTDTKAMDFHETYSLFKEDIKLSKPVSDLIQALNNKSIPLGIITNGQSQKQRKTMDSLRIHEYFKDASLILVSGELGIDKPAQAIFDAWTQRVANHNPTVYIGDSFVHDIVGAHNAGWIPIWYNPFKKVRPQVDFDPIEIFSFDDLYPLPLFQDILK